ncbi:Collagen alpha-2(V) chain, partial [Stylophora pistillata]
MSRLYIYIYFFSIHLDWIGLSKDSAALNCKDLKQKLPSAVSAVYWIDPDGGPRSNAFQVYCYQETDRGGWTLVYSYTFTAYSSFWTGRNAVTPRPSWSARDANVRVSTTVPLSETQYEAMKFALWRSIGKEFLIKSNINNWIACKEDKGSLVQQKKGSIQCKQVKQVSKQCAGTVPKSLWIGSRGAGLDARSAYYYFDGDTRINSPTHDPCGTNRPNQLKRAKPTREHFCALKAYMRVIKSLRFLLERLPVFDFSTQDE